MCDARLWQPGDVRDGGCVSLSVELCAYRHMEQIKNAELEEFETRERSLEHISK